MAQVNEYEFWQRALSGEKVGGDTLPVHESEPHCGFWRFKSEKGGQFFPMATWMQDGTLVALTEVDGRQVGVKPEAFWTRICRHPVTEDHYRERIATGRWRDEDSSVTASLQPPPVGHNEPPEVDTIRDQIDAALKGVSDYGAINSDETAAKAQSLRSRLLELSREADKRREALKRPHFEAGKAVDEAWQPLVKTAKAGADAIAKELGAHETRKAKAEADRQAAERKRLAEEAAKHAPIGAPEPVPEPAPAPVAAAPIKGAYGRAAAVKVVKVATVTDQDAAYGYLKAQPELVALIQKLAQKLVDAGFSLPGVEITEERKVS